jgi:hypothetical protein
MFDYSKAKRTLDLLLDNMHHRFEMATVYTAGLHKTKGLHFHANFYFFPDSPLPFYPSRMERDFRTALFAAWERLQAGTSVHEANKMETYKNPSYFLKNLREVQGCRRYKERRLCWWGRRNRKLIKQHSVPVSESAVDEECAKRWTGPRRDSVQIESNIPDSELIKTFWEKDFGEREATPAPPCNPVSDEWSAFEWEDNEADCERIDDMVFY